MRILHYTIGFSPARTGGLVQYVEDLIAEQENMGYEVIALYPANQFFFSNKIKIVKKAGRTFTQYELKNSLPLALFGGIQSPSDFMIPVDKAIYTQFLEELNPQVIHVHTLIGIHKEFFEAARALNIPLVFTTHDYYGLSPLPSFYYNKKSYHNDNNNETWNIMSADALSTLKLRIFQSTYYPVIRHLLKKVNLNPKHKRYKALASIRIDTDYSSLQTYYKEIFSTITHFLYNSRTTKEIFEHNLGYKPNGSVIYVTNSEISNHESPSKIGQKDGLVIAYIGPDEEYKGYFDFISWAEDMKDTSLSFKTFGHYPNQVAPSFIQQCGRFSSEDKATIYGSIDILIVPSRWYETFGLVVVEAISYGVRVVVTSSVGAKDMLPSENVVPDLSTLDNFKTVKAVELADELLMDKHKYLLETIYQSVSEENYDN